MFSGATHGTELAYLFDVNILFQPWMKTKNDRIVTEQICWYFTNFIKFGNPNGYEKCVDRLHWEPITTDNPHRQFVFRTEPVVRDDPDRQRLERLAPTFNYFTETMDFSHIT